MQNIKKKKWKENEEKKKENNPNPVSTFHSCHECLHDLERESVGEFWAIRRFLRSDFYLKDYIGQEDSKKQLWGWICHLTCQLARLQADFKIRKRYPTEAQSNFTQSRPSFLGLLISWLFLGGMSFGFIKRWVNDPNRKDLRILREPNTSSAFPDNVYVRTPTFLICVQSMSGSSPRGMNRDLGRGCLIWVSSE